MEIEAPTRPPHPGTPSSIDSRAERKQPDQRAEHRAIERSGVYGRERRAGPIHGRGETLLGERGKNRANCRK